MKVLVAGATGAFRRLLLELPWKSQIWRKEWRAATRAALFELSAPFLSRRAAKPLTVPIGKRYWPANRCLVSGKMGQFPRIRLHGTWPTCDAESRSDHSLRVVDNPPGRCW